MTTTCTGTMHSTWNAYKLHGCTCPSDNRERFVAHRQRTKRDDAKRLAQKRADGAATAPQHPARQITMRPAGSAERELRERTDLACRHVDADLFFPTGTGGSADAQIKVARTICAACPFEAQRLCLRAALDRGDDFAVLAGSTPKQRREMRRLAEERLREQVAA